MQAALERHALRQDLLQMFDDQDQVLTQDLLEAIAQRMGANPALACLKEPPPRPPGAP